MDPSGKYFVDELVYRFLLTRGDSLGGSMRNLAGAIGEWRFKRILMSTLFVQGIKFKFLDSRNKKWVLPSNEPDLEKRVRGLHWITKEENRTIVFNLTVPIVRKNVDMCLFNVEPGEIISRGRFDSAHYTPKKYIALGELKGGIDPAGADEHWKTANTALERIRSAFATKGLHPFTFFVGAAIEKAMAQEIYRQLESKALANSANLTNESQVVSLCSWLISL